MITVLHFTSNNQSYITKATDIDSILKYTSDVVITKLPQYGDASTIGIHKHLDKLYEIKDTTVYLGKDSVVSEQNNYILLFSNNIGLMVDDVSKVITINESELEPSPVMSKHITKVYIEDNTVYPYIDVV